MKLFVLTVFRDDDASPIETVATGSASRAMEVIPELLARHRDCRRIRGNAGSAYLFSVDRHGNTLHEDGPPDRDL